MTMVNLIAYAVVFGLPIWLVAEEVAHRLVPFRKSHASVSASAPAGRERRAPETARAHASFV
jgi:hypothetical protein